LRPSTTILNPPRLNQHRYRLASRKIETRIRVPNNLQNRIDNHTMGSKRDERVGICREHVVEKLLHAMQLCRRGLPFRDDAGMPQ